MNGLGFAEERCTRDDPGVLGLSDQGRVCHNPKLGCQEKVLIGQVPDILDLWYGTLAAIRGEREMSSGDWGRSGLNLEVRSNLFG